LEATADIHWDQLADTELSLAQRAGAGIEFLREKVEIKAAQLTKEFYEPEPSAEARKGGSDNL